MAFAAKRPKFTLEMDTSILVLLLGTLKIALLQPGYPEYSKRIMLNLSEELLRNFNSDTALAAMMRAEWAGLGARPMAIVEKKAV